MLFKVYFLTAMNSSDYSPLPYSDQTLSSPTQSKNKRQPTAIALEMSTGQNE